MTIMAEQPGTGEKTPSHAELARELSAAFAANWLMSVPTILPVSPPREENQAEDP